MGVVTTINDLLCADAARLILAVVLVIGSLALLFLGHPVPDFLIVLDGAAVGFYFGGNVPLQGRSS